MSSVAFLDPANIFAEIEAHPPLMREEAVKTYVGKDVNWTLTFWTGHMLDDHRVRLAFRVASQGISMVMGTVSLSEYPWLKALHANEMVQVSGRIRDIEPMSLELDISELLLVSDTSQSGKSV